MKQLFITFSLLLVSTILFAQQTIKGTITSIDGEPLSHVSIRLEETGQGGITNENGEFLLRHIKPGTYTLVASGVGYAASKRDINVVEGKNSYLDLVLDIRTQQLEEARVTATGKRPKDQASSQSARLPLANIENPQVVNIAGAQLFTQQNAASFPDIIRNLPGVVRQWTSVSPYYSSRGFNTRNYMRNGVESYTASELDPVNVQQMESIKGPSGTLFLSSLASFGGVLNRITKKPFDSTHIEVAYQGGSYDFNRFTADINTPLNSDKTVLLRVNAAQHYEGSFQDAGFLRTTFVTPSLTYKASDRLTLSFEAELYARTGTSLQQITPIGPIQPGSSKRGAENPSQLPLNYMLSYGNNSVTLKDPAINFYGQVLYKLSPTWISTTNLVRTASANTGNYLTFSLLTGDSLLVRNISNYPTSQITSTQIQQNFTNDMRIGSFRNRVVIGLEFYELANTSSSNGLGGRGGRKSFDTLNIKHAMPGYQLLSPQAIDTKLQGLAATYNSNTTNTYAAYVSDVVNVTSRLSAMLSLRVDKFDNEGTFTPVTNQTAGKYQQTAWSPKFGLVYEVVKDRVSIFGNYNNGFQNVAPVTQPNGTLSVFKPQYGNQWEGGVKTDLARGLLSTTVSYYRINVTNTLRPNPDSSTYMIQEGTQYSQGFEADVNSRPFEGLLINAGYAYNKSRLTSADPTVNGLRPVNSGPANTANWYVSYTIPYGGASGLGAGFGGNYYDRTLIVNNTTNGQFYTNTYTLMNAVLFYDRPRYRVGLSADNLTNKHYYFGGFTAITPGTLRRVMVNVLVKF